MSARSRQGHLLPKKFRDNRRVETIRAKPYERDEVLLHPAVPSVPLEQAA
jgi:hypothetical protein